MTAEPLNFTRIANDGRTVHFLEWRGRGSLSERYCVEIEGNRYFMKTYLHTDFCLGAGSRNIIRNEMYTYSTLPHQMMLYRGNIEIEDICGLLFEDMMSAGREGKSLADLIFKADAAVPAAKDPAAKEKVTAAYFLPLDEAVHIVAEVAQQAHQYHTAPHSLVHMDISPENILLINDLEGQERKRRALLSDFGLARGKASSSKYLFNQASVAGIASTYYGSDNGVFHNHIYSPPNVDDDYLDADASYDTYNIANILCLLLTGKLAEFWKKDQGAGPHSVKRREILEEQISAHQHNLAITTFNVKKIESLAEIICKGTHDFKNERYQTAQELHQALLDLEIPVPIRYQSQPALTLMIPQHIADYRVSEPNLDEVFGPELGQMQETLDAIIKESTQISLTRNHVFGGSLDAHLNKLKEREKKDVQFRQKTLKYAVWGAGIAAGIAAMMAGGMYASGYFFP